MNKILLCAFIALSLVCETVYGQEKPEKQVYHHNVEVLSAVTSVEAHQLMTIGIDYEYMISEGKHPFGIGLLTDYEMGDGEVEDELLVTPAIVYFPLHHLKLFAGAGMAFEEHHSSWLAKAGTGYEVELGHHAMLTPTFNVDLFKEHTSYVYGIALGYRF